MPQRPQRAGRGASCGGASEGGRAHSGGASRAARAGVAPRKAGRTYTVRALQARSAPAAFAPASRANKRGHGAPSARRCSGAPPFARRWWLHGRPTPRFARRLLARVRPAASAAQTRAGAARGPLARPRCAETDFAPALGLPCPRLPPRRNSWCARLPRRTHAAAAVACAVPRRRGLAGRGGCVVRIRVPRPNRRARLRAPAAASALRARRAQRPAPVDQAPLRPPRRPFAAARPCALFGACAHF